jgi:Spy/CpxP family protein refolding chaperone
MYPGMIAWWNRARKHQMWGMGMGMGCGPSEHGHGHGPGWDQRFAAGGDHDGDFGGGSFGVRRPLRFLAFRLELNEKQVTELAGILNDLKTERAQAAVDNRRATSAFADMIASETFNEAKAGEAAAERVKSAERLRDAVVKALGRIHAILDPEQRAKLAYLIRTGALTL